MRTSNHFASSIAVGDPVNGQAALEALRESRGLAFAVAEEEMVEAVNLLGSREGIFAEPASSATICAARRLVEDSIAEPSDVIVCVVTGSGLKVPDAIARALRPRLAGTWNLVRMGEKSMGPIGKTKGQILEVLEPGPNYGYSVRRQLQVRYGEEISLQAVYQHLDQLVEMGLVEVAERVGGPGKRNRKYFVLSRRGRRVLRSLDAIKESLLEGGHQGERGQILPSR
jgi:DNA-binding PadR family transcriptional regulator